eukprot:8476090-Alexandrium_andersonii.AAC.1
MPSFRLSDAESRSEAAALLLAMAASRSSWRLASAWAMSATRASLRRPSLRLVEYACKTEMRAAYCCTVVRLSLIHISEPTRLALI